MTEATIQYTVEPYDGAAQPFRPEARQPISFELTPTVQPPPTPTIPSTPTPYYDVGSYVTPSYDGLSTYPKPDYAVTDKPLVVDVETTAVNPWDGRIMCIGFKDPQFPDIPATVILIEDEREMLREFLNYYTTNGYNRIIGYHTVFDLRYIFARAMYYRISCAEWCNSKITDIMNIMQQVQEAFVPGKVKSGKLEEWMQLLLGIEKPMSIEGMLVAYKQGNYELVKQYNAVDVEVEAILYALTQNVREVAFSGLPFGSPPQDLISVSQRVESPETESSSFAAVAGDYKVKCDVCLAELPDFRGQASVVCPICDATVRR